MRLAFKHFAVLFLVFTLLLTAVLPTLSDRGLAGTPGPSARLEQIARATAFALALAALSALLFHVQIRRQATRLTRYIEAAADPAVLGPPIGPPELSGAYVAVEKLGLALDRSRDEREAAAKRLGPLTDALRVGVILCHPDKQLEFANRRVFELSGANGFEEFREGWNLVEGPVRDVMQSLDATPQSQGATIEVIMGSPLRHLRLQVYRIGPEAGEGYVALMTDPEVTALLEENVFLASQMQSLSRVYRTVVHELRSPLGAMIVNMDLLRESLSARASGRPLVRQDQDRYVVVVQKEMERLNQTLIEMLREAAPLAEQRERVDLRAVVNDLEVLIKEQARRQKIELEVVIPDTPLVVMGKTDHLKQAFLNITVNALEAMREGGRLEIGLKAHNGAAQALVCDTGPGLPPGLMERIYDMGYTTKSTGTGMGLYVARTLIEQHGGTIRAESGKGQGTCFQISLPVAATGPTV